MNPHFRPLVPEGGAARGVEESSEADRGGHEGEDEREGQDENLIEQGEHQKDAEDVDGEAAEDPVARPLRGPGAPTA